jgi:drug/metabolite transporter (DMT)-like permease
MTNHNLKGVALMLGAMAVLPFLDVCAKYLGQQGMPVIQVVWARMAFGLIFVAPMLMAQQGKAALLPDRPLLHLARAILLMSATFAFFLALTYQGIAETLAVFFVQPLVITALSPFVLQEQVGLRRWLAVLAGFIGTLVIIRPGLVAINPGSLLALASGFSLACYMLLTRKIAGRDSAMATTYKTSLMGTLIASIATLFVWQQPTPQQWLLMALLAAIASFGHLLIVKAYDHAEASLLAPLAYTEMIMAVALGWYFFGDFPDNWTFVGVGILIASAIYISSREHVRKSEAEIGREFEQP